jgi:phosphoribosyl 1,2-cyclic phosphodiesterase
VEIRSEAGTLLILDCGTGLRMLGKALVDEFAGKAIRGHILISHFHWDHIQGWPFFIPLYQKSNRFDVYSYRSPLASLAETLGGQMSQPYFPVDMRAMLAAIRFREIAEGEFQIEDFKIQARLVNHPQGCLSFRVESSGKTIVYATDNEPGNPQADRAVRELARGADVLIYDSQYTRCQLENEKKGWGHSTWEEGALIAEQNGVKKLILFHHDPDSDDQTVDRLQESARQRFPNSHAAFEAMELSL